MSGENTQEKKPSPKQATSWSLPLRAPEEAIMCPICGEPLKRRAGQLYCESSLRELASSGWQDA